MKIYDGKFVLIMERLISGNYFSIVQRYESEGVVEEGNSV